MQASPRLLLLFFSFASACTSSSPGSPPADSGARSDAMADASGPSCPGAIPGDGSACGPQGLVCEWGSADVAPCDTVALCNGGKWHLMPPATGSMCPGPLGADCPASASSVPVGQHCNSYGLNCDYGTERCACTVRSNPTIYDASAQATWICPIPNAGCPAPRARLGSACSQEGLSCDYGVCAIPGAAVQICSAGIWTQGSQACQ